MPTSILATELKVLARGREIEILERVAGLRRDVLDGKHHPCPKCGGTNRFRLVDAGKGAVLCNQCFSKKNGDFIAAVCHYRGLKFNGACREIVSFLGVDLGSLRKGPNSKARSKSPFARDQSNEAHAHSTTDLPIEPNAKEFVAKADDATLDRAYRLLLSQLILSPVHRESLRNRGLTDVAIERNEYRSYPYAGRLEIAVNLTKELGDEIYDAIPGFLRNPTRPLAGREGLLIPNRNLRGEIIALVVRLDKPRPDDSKYVYVSSKCHGGPSPGAPGHVPLGIVGPLERVRITEGAIKADIATSRSGLPTISFPGVQSWPVVLPILKTLDVTKPVVAFDADARANPAVGTKLLECVEKLRSEGYQVELEVWEHEDGKGIDDLLVGGKSPQLLEGDDALTAAREIAASAAAANDKDTSGGAVREGKKLEPNAILAKLEAKLAEGGPEALFADQQLLTDIAAVAQSDAVFRVSARLRVKAAKGRVSDFDDVIKELAAKEKATKKSEFDDVHGFCEFAGCLCRLEDLEGESVPVPMCNFTARILDDTVRDDGVDRRIHLGIVGKLESGRELPRIEVTADEFTDMDWPVAKWGSDAIIWPGNRTKVAAAIQALSAKKIRRTTFTHTGWRLCGDRWVYLHAAGAIGLPPGEEPLSVELAPPLTHYALPDPKQIDVKSVLRAELRLLDLAPDRVVFPAIAAVFRSAIGGADFSLHLVGTSGVFKSELAALMQQHFGPELDARHLPGSWSSTANSLEYAAFLAKDALFTIDDFVAGGTVVDRSRMHRDADRLLRAQGNSCGRQRMSSDGMLRHAKPPRGLIVSTGEDVPRGQSLRARMLISEVSADDISKNSLSACQADAAAGRYAGAMACYLDWLAPQYGSIRQSWSSKIAQLRAKATAAGRHARTPGIVAELKLAFLLFLKFCEEAGAITTAERESLNVRCWEALCEAAGRQAAHQSDTEPAQHFLRLIVAALASGQAHLADLDGRQPDNPQVFGWRERTIPTSAGPFREWQPQGKRIGWADGNGIYLEPDASYAEAQRLSESQGESIAVSSSTLRKRLDEKGFVIREGRRDEIRSRVTCEGKRRRVLHLKPDALQPVEHEGDGAAGREPDQNDAIGRVSRAGFESNPPKEFPAFPLENDELVGLGGSAAGTREVFAPANTTHRERDQREPAEL